MSIILAHRGASGHYPENTMVAFEKSLDLKCDGIELDIHLTSDNILVVHHDFVLGRTSNGKGYIKDKTLNELKRLDAGSWFDPQYSQEKIPTLEEVFDLVKSTDHLLNIEIKAGSRIYKGIENQLVELIKSYDFLDRCMISSFDHYALYEISELYQEIYTGALYECSLFEPWHYCSRIKANAIHPNFQIINEELIAKCYEHGIDINTYTVNDLETMRTLAALGVNCIITNYPEFGKEL